MTSIDFAKEIKEHAFRKEYGNLFKIKDVTHKDPPKALAKVIAIDFDGTLFTNDWPRIGKPIRYIIDRAKAEQEDGAKLILWTNREGVPLQEALQACRNEGLNFDAVNKNLPERIRFFGTDPRKIGADEYWDDKAVTPTMINDMVDLEQQELYSNDPDVQECLRTLKKFTDSDGHRIEPNEIKAFVAVQMAIYKALNVPVELTQQLMDGGDLSVNDVRQILGLGPVKGGTARTKREIEANWLVPAELKGRIDSIVYGGTCSNCGYIKTGPAELFPSCCPGCHAKMLPAILYKPEERNKDNGC